LAGERALEVKRAVRFPFLDYSTLAKRKEACEAELRINGSFAPDIYRRVLAITREDGGRLTLDGAGAAVEWALEMRRFDENATLDRLAQAGKIDAALADALVRPCPGRRPGQGGPSPRAPSRSSPSRGSRRLPTTSSKTTPRFATWLNFFPLRRPRRWRGAAAPRIPASVRSFVSAASAGWSGICTATCISAISSCSAGGRLRSTPSNSAR